ncbi:MAG: hypothetical protein V7K32_12710 [Nostoc sp.]
MKVNRHGRAKVLTRQKIQQIFAIGLTNERDRTQGQDQSYRSKIGLTAVW